MAGNHLKRCALMCWSLPMLNDNTKCRVWLVNNRNTEAKKTRPKIIYFWRMAGNHLKRCALMRWLFSILNDETKCLVWWVNNRNTEAGKTKTKVIQKASKGHQISTKTCQGLPKWCPGAKVQILGRFWLYFGSHFGSIFYQNSDKILQKRPPKINAGKVFEFYDKIIEKPYQNGFQIWS